MPTCILISVRNLGTGGFHAPQGKSHGTLEIPDDTELFVVDGQHRIEGLRHAVEDYGQADLGDYQIPVVILCPSLWGPNLEPDIEEGKQFMTINKMQTGVKGDLLDSFLLALDSASKFGSDKPTSGLPEDIVKMITPRVRALLVTLILNALPAWEGKVTRPNQRKGDTLVGQKAMVDSLVGFVNHPSYVANYPKVGPLAIHLNHYWEAIMDYYPNAVIQPKAFWVQKRLGATVFHRIFPQVDSLAGAPYDKASYTKVLKRAKMQSEHYWSKAGPARDLGTSFTAVSSLSSLIWP